MIFDVNAWLGVWPFRSLRDNTAQELVARMDRSNIDHAAVSLIEAVFHRYPQPANEKLAQAVEPYRDRLHPMATINPLYPGWGDDLACCHESLGMVGVRLFPVYHDYDIAGPEACELVSECAKRKLPVQIPHRLEDVREHHPMDQGETVDLNRVADLVSRVPEATIIVTNTRPIGYCPLWQRDELRDHSWYVDLSLAEVTYTLHKNIDTMKDIAVLTEQGGQKHLLFGSHMPFSYAGPALVKLAVLPVDEDAREDISSRTAARFFGVDI